MTITKNRPTSQNTAKKQTRPAKPKPEMPAEVWLMVATDALARWSAAGGQLVAADVDANTATIATDGRPAMWIGLVDVRSDDPRLSASFTTALATIAEETGKPEEAA